MTKGNASRPHWLWDRDATKYMLLIPTINKFTDNNANLTQHTLTHIMPASANLSISLKMSAKQKVEEMHVVKWQSTCERLDLRWLVSNASYSQPRTHRDSARQGVNRHQQSKHRPY